MEGVIDFLYSALSGRLRGWGGVGMGGWWVVRTMWRVDEQR